MFAGDRILGISKSMTSRLVSADLDSFYDVVGLEALRRRAQKRL